MEDVYSIGSAGINVGFGTDAPKAKFHVGGNILASSTTATNAFPTSNLGSSAVFPATTQAWFGNRISANGEDYWGLALGTTYDGYSYLQNLDKTRTNYYNLLLQPNIVFRLKKTFQLSLKMDKYSCMVKRSRIF